MKNTIYSKFLLLLAVVLCFSFSALAETKAVPDKAAQISVVQTEAIQIVVNQTANHVNLAAAVAYSPPNENDLNFAPTITQRPDRFLKRPFYLSVERFVKRE